MVEQKFKDKFETIGMNIKLIQTKKRLKNRVLAERVGISQVTLCSIKNARHCVSIRTLCEIAAAMNVSLSDLTQGA